MSSVMDGSSRTHGSSENLRLSDRFGFDERYDELPGLLKNLYSPEEYGWLDDMRKRELQRIETEPEWTEP